MAIRRPVRFSRSLDTFGPIAQHGEKESEEKKGLVRIRNGGMYVPSRIVGEDLEMVTCRRSGARHALQQHRRSFWMDGLMMYLSNDGFLLVCCVTCVCDDVLSIYREVFRFVPAQGNIRVGLGRQIRLRRSD